jgi:hypothetical protein
MSTPGKERKKNAHNNPAISGRKPISFARRLAAQPTAPPALAPPGRPWVWLTHCTFAQCIQRLIRRLFQRNSRRRKLELQEIQQLGEKRFLAIVRIGKQKFLIGGAAASVSLLAEIHGRNSTVVVPRPLGQESA